MSRVTLRAVTGSVALAVGLVGSSAAWAQCTDNFNAALLSQGKVFPAQSLFPLLRGSSVNAFVSSINTVNTAFLTTTSAFVSAPGNPQPDQQGGGAWGRVIAGTVDMSTSSVSSIDSTKYSGGSFVTTGKQNCDSSTRQDYWGYQVGHDISVLNGGASGANWHFGVTAGYLEAKTKDTTPAGSYTNPNFPGITFGSPAGSFSTETQVPFFGLYTAFTKGGLFLDGQARWDFYQNSASDPASSLTGQEFDAHGFSLTGNAGYNIPLGSGWFIEPSGGVVWSHVKIDPLNVSGSSLGNFGGRIGAGTVTIDDIDSILGRLSLRVGTNFTSGGIAWQPFFTASVFNEFAGNVTSRSVTAGNNAPDVVLDGLTLATSTSRVGTYGQFALGTAAAIVNTGWIGYARVDYRIGEDIEGWSVNTGLRYQFTPDPQRGSIKDGPGPVAYSYNWSGPYIGAYTGALWAGEDWRTSVINTQDHPRPAGYVAGGQAGYNVQAGNMVVGIEGDYGFANAKGGKSCTDIGQSVFVFFYTCEGEVDRLASLTGRVGYAMGRALFYAKGGLAGGEVTAQTHFNIATAKIPPSNTPINGESKWLMGWTAGAGMEFALTDRWSAKAEYMRYQLESDNFRIDSGLVADAQTWGNVVRIGINLHLHPVQREVPLK